jgi:hypothetical protein
MKIDARNNYIFNELFVCGCYESELCSHVISGVFIALILLKHFLNGSKRNEMGINITEFVP